ncbi:MAG: DUF4375 domain-containing protein [Planctomycetota bacterium]
MSDKKFNSDDSYDIIESNIAFLNAQFEEHLTHDEVSPNALRSYYVDYYLAQVNNGGFSQFVYNSGWQPQTIQYLCEGLEAMGAEKHLELLTKAAQILDQLGPDRLQAFFESDYFGENEERDILNKYDDLFFELSEQEDLIELNAKWLRQLPNIVVISVDEAKAELRRRADSITNRDARIAESLANEPRYTKLIRALCQTAGHELNRVTAGDPTYEHDGRQMIAWHFLSDKGHHYMVDVDGKAFMFNGDTDEGICEIEVSDDFANE